MLPKFPFRMKVCHDDFTTFLMALVMLLLATIPLQHLSTVFENHRKSLIQNCERSELGLQLIKNPKNGQFWRVFENLKLAVKQCYQTGQF